MKKITTLLFALAAILIMSCHHHPHVTIASHSNNSDIRLEYTGTMAFSNDRTKLEGMSRDGYLDYKRNNDELRASPDDAGRIQYELNGTHVNKLDGMGQNLLDEAIGMIIKSSH